MQICFTHTVNKLYIESNNSLLFSPKIDKLLYSAHLHVHVKEEGDPAFFFPEISKAIS
jgi:hypothetical protein